MNPDPRLLTPLPAHERPFQPGGLMRCCTATIANTDTLTLPGDVLDCRYEELGNAKMIVDAQGVWRWNRP